MSAQAVDLGTGDSDRWEALNRERREAISDDAANICTLNAHGQYGFPGRHRRSVSTESSSHTASGSGSSTNTKGGDSSDSGGGMLSWAWRVVESPRRRTNAGDQPASEQSQRQDDVDAFFKAEGGA